MKGNVIRGVCRWVTLLILLCILSIPIHAQEAFDCHITDIHGQEINGCYSKDDEIWYLFVPSTEDVASLDLYVRGAVTDATGGTLDVENGVIAGAFAEDDELTLICGDEEIRVAVKQSELPSLHIVLNDATLDEVHEDKDEKFKNNSVYLSDPDGEHDLVVEDSVELKGRGNSTWRLYEKKGYQIKFDSKTSVMGMGKAKKWVLLANASDDSLMRTQLTYQMARQMDMPFVPTFKYVDLWINGEYRGTYILGEKVELGGSRLDLEDDMGALFEHDEAFYMEEDYWFYSDYLGRHFVLKESMEEDDETVIHAVMDEFEAVVNELTKYLYSTPAGQVTLEELSAMIDVDSFVQYYLVNEYTQNRESFATSFYWYKDGTEDVVHLGPIWDFDTCMGNDGTRYTENYGDEHILFQYLLAIPEFYERTQELKDIYMPLFTEMDDNIADIYDEIAASAEMNYLRWDVLGKANPKGGEAFRDTYEEAVEALQAWLEGREGAFSIPHPRSVTSVVSGDCSEMEIQFQEDESYSSVKFAVWSVTGGQDDLEWCTASRNSQGIWSATVDLSQHNSAGIYRIDVHPDGAKKAAVSGRSYVETALEPAVWIETDIAEDYTTMDLVFWDKEQDHNQINIAVWSAEGGQDDIFWYPAVKNEAGEWVCEVDLTKHNSAGTYHIHAYSELNGISTWATLRNVYVAKAVSGPEVVVDFSDDNTDMIATLKYARNAGGRIWFALWSAENGQDDLRWYEATKKGALWNSEIDLTPHASIGDYHIHVYGGTEAPNTLLAFDTVDVPAPIVPLPELTIETMEEDQVLYLTLEHAEEYERVWFPVWTEENGQDDIFWYEGEKQPNGNWTCTVRTNVSGIYVVHVYGGENAPEELLMDRKAAVEVTEEITGPQLSAEVRSQSLTLVLEGAEEAKSIWIPVWSEAYGQDDIVWYRPERGEDGVWRVEVDLNDHGPNGTYHIHVYQGMDSPGEMIAHTSIQAEGVGERDTRLSVEADEGIMHIALESEDEYQQVWLPVWSDENGQDDLVWYQPKFNGKQWCVEVDLENHAPGGTYHIHAYTGTDAPETLVVYTTVQV